MRKPVEFLHGLPLKLHENEDGSYSIGIYDYNKQQSTVSVEKMPPVEVSNFPNTGEEVDIRKPYPPMIMPSFKDADLHMPSWVTDDGIIYGGYSNRVLKSRDDWKTREEVVVLGDGLTQGGMIQSVRDLNNGELLVIQSKWSDGEELPKVWVSEGYSNEETDTEWHLVLKSSDMEANFNNRWGVDVYNNIVFLSEYGDRGKAVKAYLSKDYGKTFKEVFDLSQDTSDPKNAHIHSSAYDPYRNWLWLTTGDASNSSTRYSMDLGKTWITLDDNDLNVRGVAYQQTTIIPMSDCVLFLSDRSRVDDNPPMYNGVWRLPITDDNMFNLKSEDIEQAYKLDESEYLTYVGAFAYRNWIDPEHPVYFTFTRAGGSSPAGFSVVLATFDGYKFHKVYEDYEALHGGGSGIDFIAGPTKEGKLIGTISDPNRTEEGRGVYFIADAPKWV